MAFSCSSFDPFSPNMAAFDHFHGGSGNLGLETAEIKDAPRTEVENGCQSGESFSGLCENHVNLKKKGESQKKTRRHRYAFQTRSRVDILDDGYRWRKYGQKSVKNNAFPRSYYRCTQHGCNVKKQVQRHSNDEDIVVTTYEGVHTHTIEKPTDNFEHILSRMQVYTTPF